MEGRHLDAEPRSFESVIADFVRERQDQLAKDYQWDLPSDLPPGIAVAGGDTLTRTRQLKDSLRKTIMAHPERRIDLLTWWVKDWGGVKALKRETLSKHVQQIPTVLTAASLEPKHFDGVASWSKVAALLHPEVCAIYDARVAFSVNALNFLRCQGKAPIYPVPPGRNGKLGFLDIVTLLRTIKLRQRVSGLVQVDEAWRAVLRQDSVPEHDAYGKFMSIVGHARSELQLERGDIAEMVLFANAETLAREVWQHVAGRGP